MESDSSIFQANAVASGGSSSKTSAQMGEAGAFREQVQRKLHEFADKSKRTKKHFEGEHL